MKVNELTYSFLNFDHVIPTYTMVADAAFLNSFSTAHMYVQYRFAYSFNAECHRTSIAIGMMSIPLPFGCLS